MSEESKTESALGGGGPRVRPPTYSTREIIVDFTGEVVPLKGGVASLGHNPSWVKAADYDQLAAQLTDLWGDRDQLQLAVEQAHEDEREYRAANEELHGDLAEVVSERDAAEKELEALRIERDHWQRVAELCGGDADRWIAKYQALRGAGAALPQSATDKRSTGLYEKFPEGDVIDRAASLVFWPLDYAEGKGRLIGWPLTIIGLAWAMACMVPIMLPAIVCSIVADVDNHLRRDA